MKRSVVVTSLVALAFFACIPFGDSWLHFGGVVRDPSGHPVADAQVVVLIDGKIENDRSTTRTDAAGHYAISENSCPCDFQFELRVTKPGYLPYTKRLRGRAANELSTLDVTLVPRNVR